jgi:hypothetical protein
MAHRNPYKARLARWQKRWPVPLVELQAQAYAVLQLAYEGVDTDDPEQRRKAILCYFQALTSFTKLREATEFEARLKLVEDRLDAQERMSVNGRYASAPRAH